MILKKEFILVVSVLCIIFFLEVITNRITEDYTATILNQVEKIKEEVERGIDNGERKNEISDMIWELKNDWEKKQNIFATFMGHGKLEKVAEVIVYLETNIENCEYNQSLENINEIIYILEKFDENDDLLLKNIF